MCHVMWSYPRSFTIARVSARLIRFSVMAHCGPRCICRADQCKLADLVAESARSLGITVHNGGTYVNMERPGFFDARGIEFNHRTALTLSR